MTADDNLKICGKTNIQFIGLVLCCYETTRESLHQRSSCFFLFVPTIMKTCPISCEQKIVDTFRRESKVIFYFSANVVNCWQLSTTFLILLSRFSTLIHFLCNLSVSSPGQLLNEDSWLFVWSWTQLEYSYFSIFGPQASFSVFSSFLGLGGTIWIHY